MKSWLRAGAIYGGCFRRLSVCLTNQRFQKRSNGKARSGTNRTWASCRFIARLAGLDLDAVCVGYAAQEGNGEEGFRGPRIVVRIVVRCPASGLAFIAQCAPASRHCAPASRQESACLVNTVSTVAECAGARVRSFLFAHPSHVPAPCSHLRPFPPVQTAQIAHPQHKTMSRDIAEWERDQM